MSPQPQEYLRYAPRIPAALALLYGFSLFVGWGFSADDKPVEKSPPPEPPRHALSKVSNDDLLKQSTAIHVRGSGDYLAAARSLAAAERRLAEVAESLAQLAPGASASTKPGAQSKEKVPKEKEPAAEDAARTAVEAAKARSEVAKQRLKLTQQHKTAAEEVVANVESLQSAAMAFLIALDDLKPYAVELSLRAVDGTLPEDKQPAELRLGAVEKKRKVLVEEQTRLKSKLTDARKAAEVSARTVEEADKNAGKAEAESVEASRVFAREQQRHEIEKKYAGRKSDEMLVQMNQLVQDGNGLKGTYELGFQRFVGQANSAEALRKELSGIKQPEIKIGQLTRPEDVQQAATAIEGLITYYNGRIKKIEALKSNLTTLEKLGAEFEADATVSDDHLFRMEVLSALLVKAEAADKLPPQAEPKRLAEATDRAKKLAAEVRAGTEKARTEIPSLDKELSEARSAATAAAQQHTSLKQSQDATLAAIRYEEQLAKMPAGQIVTEFQKLRTSVTEKNAAIKSQEEDYRKANAAVVDARSKLDDLKDPLLRAAEEQGQGEKQRIIAELRKDAGLEQKSKGEVEAKKIENKKTEAKKSDDKNVDAPEKKPEPPPPPLERVAAQLAGFQQQLAARVRVLDEREEKTRVLLATLTDLEKKASAYSQTLAQTRQVALELNAAAVNLKTRIGRGELDVAILPDGITEALGFESRKQLEGDAAAVLNVLSQTRADLETLKKPDPDVNAIKSLSKDLLRRVGQRLDLLGDLRKLMGDYKRTKKERPDSEQKRLDQGAADRMNADAGQWDWFLALDQSKQATNLVELLETYYRELVEIEDKEENLKKQCKAIDDLIDLTNQERSAIQKAMPVLEKELVRLAVGREEEQVLIRARVKPESSDELLKAYQTKTGRVLPKPLPLGETDRAAKVESLGNALFERFVQLDAATKWNEVLTARLATAGLTAEAGVYQDELAQLNATSGTNARRVSALTGNLPQESGKLGLGEQIKLPATGGEIGKTRSELTTLRGRGAKMIGVKIGITLLCALLLPRIILFVVRRALRSHNGENGSSSMVVTALGAFLRVTMWVVAIAIIMSILGFDVTAIIAGLGIGGLAIGLAAQPMLSDVIGAIIIFAERRFRIGDVVKLGAEEPARVVGLTWRSTALKTPDGLVLSVPNRKVTETAVLNLTRSGQTYDSLAVTVNTDKDVNKVLDVIKKAMNECQNLSADHGVSVKKFNQKGNVKVVEYRFWWFLKDYESRNKTRDEVFARIGEELAHENLVGTELTMT